MKRNLAAAALMTLGSYAASAEASVTLYGLLDGGFAYQNVAGTWQGNRYSQSVTSMVSSGRSGTRWGIRGVEDLGNGMRAIFQLEGGFSLDDGKSTQGGRLFGRHATVGLASNAWGRLDLGRQTNIASKFGNAIVDPFEAAFTLAAAGTSFSAMNTARYDNMAMYQSPILGGFRFGVGYSFSVEGQESVGGDKPATEGKGLTSGVQYASGPIGAFLTYDQIKFDASDVTIKEWIGGAAYDFGVVKVSAAYGKTTDGWFAGRSFGALSTGTYVTAEGLDVNSYLLALSAPLGNGKLRASWQIADPKTGAIASKTVAFVGDDLSTQHVYSLGYTYDLSKRTDVYIYGSYAEHALFQADLDTKLVSLGMRHRF